MCVIGMIIIKEKSKEKGVSSRYIRLRRTLELTPLISAIFISDLAFQVLITKTLPLSRG